MNTLFDKTVRVKVIGRINTLNDQSRANWGKMNVSHMIRHCSLFDEMVLGKKKYKHSLIGKLFGKSVLKGMLKDERPMKKNLPTFLALKVTGNVEVGPERNKWVGLIAQYELFDGDGFMHPFFGWVTREQSGYLAYKHADHHLRQFNA